MERREEIAHRIALMEADRLEKDRKSGTPPPKEGVLASREGSVASDTQPNATREGKERQEVNNVCKRVDSSERFLVS